MRKSFLIPALLTALAVVACDSSSNGEGPNPPKPEVLTTTVNFSNIGLGNAQDFTSYSINDLTIAGDIGGNTNNASPKYYTGDKTLRIYDKNTLTFTGTNITAISINSNNASYTADVGKLVGKEWTGDVSTVTFKATAQVRISSVTVTHVGIKTDEGGGSSSDYTVRKVMEDLDIWAFPEEYDFSEDLKSADDGRIYCDFDIEFDENVENTEECLLDVLEYCISEDTFPSYLSQDGKMYVNDGYGNVFLATPDKVIAVYLYDVYQDGAVYVGFEAAPYDYYNL